MTGAIGRSKDRRMMRLGIALAVVLMAGQAGAVDNVLHPGTVNVDRPTIAQTLPAALEWLWKDYPIP